MSAEVMRTLSANSREAGTVSVGLEMEVKMEPILLTEVIALSSQFQDMER